MNSQFDRQLQSPPANSQATEAGMAAHSDLLEVFGGPPPDDLTEFRNLMWQGMAVLLRRHGELPSASGDCVQFGSPTGHTTELSTAALKRELGYHLPPKYPKFHVFRVSARVCMCALWY